MCGITGDGGGCGAGAGNGGERSVERVAVGALRLGIRGAVAGVRAGFAARVVGRVGVRETAGLIGGKEACLCLSRTTWDGGEGEGGGEDGGDAGGVEAGGVEAVDSWLWYSWHMPFQTSKASSYNLLIGVYAGGESKPDRVEVLAMGLRVFANIVVARTWNERRDAWDEGRHQKRGCHAFLYLGPKQNLHSLSLRCPLPTPTFSAAKPHPPFNTRFRFSPSPMLSNTTLAAAAIATGVKGPGVKFFTERQLRGDGQFLACKRHLRERTWSSIMSRDYLRTYTTQPTVTAFSGQDPCVIVSSFQSSTTIMQTQTLPIDPKLLQSDRHKDELREKAKVRMAVRRQAIKASGEVSEEHSIRVKAAHAKYRAKNAKFLAFKQRLRRQEAFIAKYGVEAHRKRIASETAKGHAAEIVQAAAASQRW
ncbi:hypothetical protein DFH08DRAFT_799103 [Mycena albidolilacea]|uniref:Uncharacterized protein n=1 Tax=Mycena albidolilacea TaxID=1033008 RepID=A0AAD7AQD8_9AGAR|nr:hypothetical protein DFH08DRAFT_799103 [Mycena albidolilacea]